MFGKLWRSNLSIIFFHCQSSGSQSYGGSSSNNCDTVSNLSVMTLYIFLSMSDAKEVTFQLFLKDDISKHSHMGGGHISFKFPTAGNGMSLPFTAIVSNSPKTYTVYNTSMPAGLFQDHCQCSFLLSYVHWQILIRIFKKSYIIWKRQFRVSLGSLQALNNLFITGDAVQL